MAKSQPNIGKPVRLMQPFLEPGLTARIADLERTVKGCGGTACRDRCEALGATSALLEAACALKQAAAQIHVLVHAAGMLKILPMIMGSGETIEYVSLGAGNTGKTFDLATNYRVAEFKFIHWKGGPETARKKALFKDFYRLAEAP